MSVAFRRESDEEHLEPKFELPIPPGPNYVTPTGLAQIEARVAELEAAVEAGGTEDQVKALRRDLRYWHQRQSSAIPAPHPAAGAVGIGSTVTFTLRDKQQVDDHHRPRRSRPRPRQDRLRLPLARALLGLSAGDFADFGGEEEAIEIKAVSAA